MANETKKTRVKGFSNNGQVFPAQTGFDTEYENITIVDRVKKTGSGEDDFVIVKEVLVEKTPIKEVIDADAESVGVYNIIKQVLRTGDTSLLPVDKGGNYDFVDAPESLMELGQLGDEAAKKYASLDPELTKGLDMKSFVESLTQEQFDAFIKAVAERNAPKENIENEQK